MERSTVVLTRRTVYSSLLRCTTLGKERFLQRSDGRIGGKKSIRMNFFLKNRVFTSETPTLLVKERLIHADRSSWTRCHDGGQCASLILFSKAGCPSSTSAA